MSLDLDKRQRAILREMGVRVWQPPAVRVEPVRDLAPDPAPPTPRLPLPSVRAERTDPATPVPPPATPRPVPAAASPVQRTAPAPGAAASWRLGHAHALYVETALAGAPRWLILAETPAGAMQAPDFHPLAGDAGRLLDNMLKAARLDRAGAVSLLPLARLAASDAEEVQSALPALIATARPDIVLVMGRLAAQALLQTTEPFGKVRGQVHTLHGARFVLTCDATYLLRNPAEKARVWDDLCLAMAELKRR